MTALKFVSKCSISRNNFVKVSRSYKNLKTCEFLPCRVLFNFFWLQSKQRWIAIISESRIIHEWRHILTFFNPLPLCWWEFYREPYWKKRIMCTKILFSLCWLGFYDRYAIPMIPLSGDWFIIKTMNLITIIMWQQDHM